ncbi:MAG: cellulase family glycosylhydrolase, partial [Pseudomonadota bacterium]
DGEILSHTLHAYIPIRDGYLSIRCNLWMSDWSTISLAAVLLLLGLNAHSHGHPSCRDKMALWSNDHGPQLRGAVIYQRKYYEELEDEALGRPPAGPLFKADDFTALAACGANAVVVSHPGVFTEDPPYRIDQDLVAHLDHLLTMIERADLFAVLAIRTGPGRSEFTFFHQEAGTWFGAEKLNDHLWSSREAQDAWVAMWRFLANRYRSRSSVVGYELMVEPNSSDVGSDVRSDRINIQDPARFHRRYGQTTYDWNQLHPRIVTAIRKIDPDTPILISGNGYGGVAWLPYIKGTKGKGIVHVAHSYEPPRYTQQETEAPLSYPGNIDIRGDGEPRPFDAKLINTLLRPVTRLVDSAKVPVAVTEIGTVRWAPGADLFLNDTMLALEELGTNYFVFEWSPDYAPYTKDNNAFNFQLGTEPQSIRVDPHNTILSTVCRHWRNNVLRPSKFLPTKLEQ